MYKCQEALFIFCILFGLQCATGSRSDKLYNVREHYYCTSREVSGSEFYTGQVHCSPNGEKVKGFNEDVERWEEALVKQVEFYASYLQELLNLNGLEDNCG